jgi:hypothetical protein
MTQRASSRSALPAAILATGIVTLAGCGGSSSSAGAAQPASGTTASAAAAATAAAATAAASAATCPTAAAVSAAAGVTYAALQVMPPSSGFPQTVCNYSGTNQALTVGLYPAGTTLSSLTSVATGTLTPVSGLGSQADSTTTPNSAVYVFRSSGAFSVVDGSDLLHVGQVEAVAKVVLAG